MKYSKEATERHALSCQHRECLQLLTAFIKEQGGKGTLFCNKESCINLDDVEELLHPHNLQATMDLTVGLFQNRKEEQMLLIELRFKYKSPKNIGAQDIRKKIEHSKDLLSGSIVHPYYIFVFKENVIGEAKSHFNRLFAGKKTPCLILTEQELHEQYFRLP